MAPEQFCMFPAGRDDRAALLSAFELSACSGMQLGQAVWAEIGLRMTLEPIPQVHGPYTRNRGRAWQISRVLLDEFEEVLSRRTFAKMAKIISEAGSKGEWRTS
jgi:hypothetical protein